MLFTAQAYVDDLRSSGLSSDDIVPVQGKLAGLVRCPHLSPAWRAAAVLSDSASEQLLGGLQKPLRRLLLLQLQVSRPLASRIESDVPGAPSSWLLPTRTCKRVSSVQLEWAVDVAAIKQATQTAANTHTSASIGRSAGSPPLRGISWRIEPQCIWHTVERAPHKQGVIVGVFAEPANLPPGMISTGEPAIECLGFPLMWPCRQVGAPVSERTLFSLVGLGSCLVHSMRWLGPPTWRPKLP